MLHPKWCLTFLILKNCRNCNGPKPIVVREIQKFVENGTFDDKSNMDVAHKALFDCSKGNVLREIKYECNNFRLEKNDKSGYNLLYKDDIYPPDSFCFDDHDNGKYLIAKMCIRQSRQDRYK